MAVTIMAIELGVSIKWWQLFSPSVSLPEPWVTSVRPSQWEVIPAGNFLWLWFLSSSKEPFRAFPECGHVSLKCYDIIKPSTDSPCELIPLFGT